MARTMIHENNLAKQLWAEAVNTRCYVQNRIYMRPIVEKIAYEFFKGRRPNISYFHQFGFNCYILNNKVYLKKFDAKAQKGISLGYSERLKAYRVYNSETLCLKVVSTPEAQVGSQQANQSKNTFKYKSSHPEDLIIGNKESPRRTRSYFRQEESLMGLLSLIEPATVDEALSDDGWILAMQEVLNQFQRNEV